MVMNSWHVRICAGAHKLTGLSKDPIGQVSFSLVAVVLLVVTGVTGAYLAKRQMDELNGERRDSLLDKMEATIQDIVQELTLVGASRAQRTVSGWQSYPVNESEISQAFSVSMARYINSSFPREKDGFQVEVLNWTGGLFFVEQNTYDLSPSNRTRQSTLELEGANLSYAKQASPSSEEIGERTSNPYYVALGNFSVRTSQKTVALARQSSFQRPVISALPFIESKLRAFEAASEGEYSDLAKMVGYMLSTLGELRILEGYGEPMYTGLDTSQVLTEEDVYKAVSVGLLLEQARLFRSVDERFESEVSALCGGSLGSLALHGSKPRYLDPAELFLWFLGITRPDIDPALILSQAVYGLADQLVVKLMEYMGWLGAIDTADQLLDVFGDVLAAAIDRFTGENRSSSAVKAWISKAIGSTGQDPLSYDAVFSSSCDFCVPVPERQYYVEDAAGNLYPVWVGNFTASVDVPTCFLISDSDWSGFYRSYKQAQSSVREDVQDSVMHLAFEISRFATLDFGGASINPADSTDLFTALAASCGNVEFGVDNALLASAVKALPMFSDQYELAMRFSDFVGSSAATLVERDGLLESALSGLASSVVSSAKYSYIPNLAVPVEEQLSPIVRADIQSDTEWGVAWATERFIDAVSRERLNQIVSLVNSSVIESDGRFMGPMVDAVATLLVSGTEMFPGLEKIVEEALAGFAKGAITQKELSSFKDSVYVDLANPFEFWEGNRESAETRGRILNESLQVSVIGGLPPMQAVPFDPDLGYYSLQSLFPTGDILVQIKRPWDFDRSKSDYPNIHLTSIKNVSMSPFTTQWTVSVLGLVEMSVRSGNSALGSLTSENSSESRSSVRIELCMPIVLHSAWPLSGVDYNPSNTALGDLATAMKKFCSMVWKKLEPAFGWIKDGFERIYGFLSHAFETLASYATRLVKVLSAALQTMVETLQSFIQKLANSVLGKAVSAFIDLVGRVEFRISLYGFLIIVQTNLPDLIYRHGTDMLRVIVATDRFGPGLSLGIRVARLTDGSWDVLANGTLSMKHVKVDVAVDPLMLILRRFVEMHCQADKWALDLMVPEVEPYELAEVSTSDLPGIGTFLSNIPLPVLGLSASIEAGLRLKYEPPFPSDIVINEFESNPAGDDTGREWVELYNPLDRPKCVDGWMLKTMHGKDSEMAISGTIPAHGLLVFKFKGISIDNGDPDNAFNDGDSVVLADAAGATVDVTPMLRDTSDDDRTNQRCWDGGPRWVFRTGSMGSSNGAPVLLAGSEFIAKALFESFKQAFEQTQLQEVTASLNFLVLFAKRVLNNFIENLLSIVGEVIREVVLFIKVTLCDATGSAGVGIRTSFVVTGGAIVDLLRWLIQTMATFIVNLGRASHPLAYPVFPLGFFSGLYIRFEVLFEVGLPRMVRLLGAVGPLDQKFTCAAVISPNIPAIGKIVGRNWGNWSIDFGVCLSGVPKEFAAGFLTKDTGKYVDFWLVKARIYGL